MSSFRELSVQEPAGLLGDATAGFNIRFESTEDCVPKAAEPAAAGGAEDAVDEENGQNDANDENDEGEKGEDEEQKKARKVIVDL